MLTIYLTRHGQDEDNAAGILNGRRDMPLTDLGRSQAETLAGKIKASKLSFDAMYSSPQKRAFETASIVHAKGLDEDNRPSSIEKVDDLAERDFGVLTGKKTADICTLVPPDGIFKTASINYFLSPEGAETFPQLKERASRALAFLNKKHASSQDSILLVAHGDFGKMFYAAYYDLDWKDVLRDFHFGNAEVILCSPNISKPSSDQTHIFSIEQFNS
eukprot:jgi/Psemu1/226160/e_gw1.1737.6.1